MITNSVTNIEPSPFDGCRDVISIVVEEGNPVYDSRGHCNGIIETATNKLVQACQRTAIPDDVSIIGDYAYGGQRYVYSVSLPNSLKVIENGAFADCPYLSSIVIPDSVVRIGNSVFTYCVRLKSATFGASVAEIGTYIFSNCSNLTDVKCRAQEPPACVTTSFSGVYTKATLHVLRPSLDAYRAHEVWSQFTNIEALPGAGPGDMNGDGEFTVSDITLLINAVVGAGENVEYNADADVNGDGDVNITDVIQLINQMISAR